MAKVTFINDAGEPEEKEVLSAEGVNGQIIMTHPDGTKTIRPAGAILKVEDS